MNRSDVASTRNSDLKEAIDCIKNDQIEAGMRKYAIMDVYPWMAEFRALCKSTAAQRDPSSLIKLMRFFNRNVSSNVNDCYKKSSRAAKLKELIKEALLSFMYYHLFEQPQDHNRAVYLELMSDLLAMYIDLELVASKRYAEPQHGKISARLVAYLYVYLECSTEHLLDTVIKVQHINETYSHILDAVISKLLKIVPTQPDSEVQYVRYLLIYRLWKRLHSNLTEKKQINTVAMGVLGSRPAALPEQLERLLPCGAPAGINEHLMTKFYLCQAFDLRKACTQFLEFCRPAGVDGSDVNERDPRLNSTLTSVTSEISKSSNSVSNSNNSTNSIKDSINIPFAKLEINSNNKQSHSFATKDSSNSSVRVPIKTEHPRPRKPKKLGGIVLIDLTEEVTKIVKSKSRRKLGWLDAAKRCFDEKMKQASALKKAQSAEASAPKISTEDTAGRSSAEASAPKISTEDTAGKSSAEPKSTETAMETEQPQAPIVTSPEASIAKLVCYDSDSNETPEETALPEPSNSTTVSSSEAPSQEDSALCDADNSSKDEQPAESSASSLEPLKEASSPSEGPRTESRGACSVICAAPTSPIGQQPRDEAMEVGPVNLTLKTDNYPNKPKVQEDLAEERASLIAIDESLICAEKNFPATKKREDREEENVEAEAVGREEVSSNGREEAQPSPSHEYSQERQQDANVGESTELPTTSSGGSEFYDIPEPEIDGLTLLARVSAQQIVSPSKKAELKVKPFSSLQQPQKQQVFNRVVEMSPEDATDKVAFQVEVSSSVVISPTGGKSQQDQDTSSSDLMSYMLDEQLQGNLENNENANVILNGETVMLLQKSPNSNLYIINKADKVGKMSYDSEEEEASKPEPEESKCYQQGMMIKSDPDYPKSNVVVPCQFIDCFCGGWNCINRTAQSVQRLPLVHAKACSMRAEAAAMLAKIYNDKMLCDTEKGQMAAAAAATVQVEQDVVSRFVHLNSKLPLKKRLKAQMMLSMDLGNKAAEPPFNSEPVAPSYPGTLMMSIADVEVRSDNPPHELGAVVEVTSATVKPTKSKGARKEKAINGKRNNQNVPNCFPRKSRGKKNKRLAANEEVENSAVSSAKIPRKSSGSSAKRTRSSNRIVPTVNYVYPEVEHACNPSGKRKKKKGNR